MNLTPESKVLIQGFCEFILATHISQMQAYGTNLVAGVNPGYGGQQIYDLPVFDLVEEVVAKFGQIDTTIICVQPDQVLDAALEAMASNIPQIIIITAGVPPLDMVQLLRKTEACETLIIGPNSPGIIVPGKILLGTQPSEFYIPGSVGIVSRSSTLTYEVAGELTKVGLGQSISVSIGSDAIVGSSFLQWLQILDEDETTEAIVLIGQPGGNSEEAAAQYIIEAIDKPVIAYIAGRHAPSVHNWQQTGTLASVIGRSVNFGTAESKLAAFESAKIPVADSPSQIPKLLKNILTPQRVKTK
ncbi:CoA-binding protein [Aphanizomenon flos-aquae NRERC-008]|jgi:succinyl-CoA synthetase alpha subunit|uniref:CoA-binding protein n=2 Tax=Aphanizomenon flos-aquae TaxID=1176 RepID=A0A1B7X3A1_APHFL|nr:MULTISPECIES: CoA-binding protein [Aphanizomenon]MCE2903689.1 CoA-binding protein [Anabaena sp. CoA2_C59]MDJ0505838.1 CoA-binding protein [Nostocales cyanobacterium LE14-WE12]OBQ27976.1 MAG: CoA-binding protein [Aphanizomenon flos-aquae MDT14a]OBQ43837.1 MAG: CoA-binding protein [Aphanizomenon flos-aquae WA102]MBD2392589.1 CoA-binding protein [Aphanizomenon flos-aquae FACHB-1171]